MIFAVVQIDQPQGFGGIERVRSDISNERRILDRGQTGDQVVELKNETHVFASILCQLVFVRSVALGGMIYPDDAIRMALWDRKKQPLEASCSGTKIEVGRGDVRSTYCFRVAPL